MLQCNMNVFGALYHTNEYCFAQAVVAVTYIATCFTWHSWKHWSIRSSMNSGTQTPVCQMAVFFLPSSTSSPMVSLQHPPACPNQKFRTPHQPLIFNLGMLVLNRVEGVADGRPGETHPRACPEAMCLRRMVIHRRRTAWRLVKYTNPVVV